MDEEGNFLTVKCDYDFMGRRVFKKVISGTGTVISHQRFIYRGYLQIACVDLTRTNHPALWLITWDPTQPVATRPLAIQKDGTWYTYGLDLTKNVCEVFGATGYIRTAYTYSPYGQVTATGNVTQPIQWSSEFNDEELGLVYYNYRYYNTQDGKWMSRDYIIDIDEYNLYRIKNTLYNYDLLGLKVNVLFYGPRELLDDNLALPVYREVKGDVETMNLRSGVLDENNKVIYYKDRINTIEKDISEHEFNNIVKSGNLRQRKYKNIKINTSNGREYEDDLVLNDTKEQFIERAKRELESTALHFSIRYTHTELLYDFVLNHSNIHFRSITDARNYDYNVLILHGAKDGTVCYGNNSFAPIKEIKSTFEKQWYNNGKNYLFCCYMHGESIIAGIRPAKILFKKNKNCLIIEFIPSAPYHSVPISTY